MKRKRVAKKAYSQFARERFEEIFILERRSQDREDYYGDDDTDRCAYTATSLGSAVICFLGSGVFFFSLKFRNFKKLRLCLFWVKITSGNAFPEMRLFGRSGKFYFPEIEIR